MNPPRRPRSPAAALVLLCFVILLLPPTTATAAPTRADAARASSAGLHQAEPGIPAGEAGWPLRPRPKIVRGFERPPKPWMPGHRGLDLAGSPGQPVLSATAGTITYAGQLAGRGVIVVTRGPIRTTYEPVVPSIRTGAIVQSGDQIGRLSAAGSHCSPAACLHWGLRQADNYLDPLSLLPSQPVRLLPLNDEQTPTEGTDRATGPTGLNHPTASNVRPHQTATPTPDNSKSASDAGTATAGHNAAVGRLADDHGGGTAAGIVVGIAAVITVGGALMIRRH